MLHHYPQISPIHPPIHHPPIAQPIHPSIHSIQPQLYSHPAHSLLPHPQPQPHPHHPSQHSPQTLIPIVSTSYLPSATTLYASLLQPLSIKLLNPFPHSQHQIQTQTSTFGFSNVYPTQPLFSLSQSTPHLPLRPAQISLSASSQQALHEFMSQCEILLPGCRGNIEPRENGESCTVRDFDGNLVEVYWTTHTSRIPSLYAPPNISPRISHPQRALESTPAFSPLRERELERHQPFPPQRERNVERERNNRVREDKRIEQAQGNKRIALQNTPYETDNRPTRENRRVLQWQQDVVNSTRDHDDKYNDEEFEETEEIDRSEDSGYPEDNEPTPRQYMSHKYLNHNHREHREKRNTSEPYQETHVRADNFQIHEALGEDYLPSHERRKEVRRQKDRYLHDSRRNSNAARAERTAKKMNLSPRSNPNFGLLATDEPKIGLGRRRARSFSGSVSPSPTDFDRLNLDGRGPPQISHEHYNERTKREMRFENELSRRKSDRRRDSGIGGLGGMKISVKDRADSEFVPIQRYRGEGKNTIRASNQREKRHARKNSESSNTNKDSHSRRLKGRELERINESRNRYQSSQSETDVASDISYSSGFESAFESEFESEPDLRPESSHRFKERRQVRGNPDEGNGKQYQVQDLERIHKKKSTSQRYEQNSKKHSRKGKSRDHDYKSNSHYSSGIPVITQCPSSNSGPSMGAEKFIPVQVPTPPSALPKHSQRRDRRKVPVTEDVDDFSDDFQSFGENEYENSTREWMDKQSTPHVTSRHRYDIGHPSGDSAPQGSNRRREPSRAARHRYVSSPDPSETSSSIDKQRDRIRDRKGKGRRSTRY
ncbi:putative blumeria specific protein [Golovinomyces cichoracearum]|uniref:Putative blumeria specific protein n=1 Tax=Golovinomyces cichoracearum TaxID=62708 RepID=A0A420IWN6_9PEZI|nr:putative blumeria specific protein [Golovinomyces cichoracearum]